MATVQELLALGQQMGLDDTELKDFVTEQQALTREEREKERQAEKEKRQYEEMFLMEQEAAKERDRQLTYYTEHTKRIGSRLGLPRQ